MSLLTKNCFQKSSNYSWILLDYMTINFADSLKLPIAETLWISGQGGC